MTEQEKETIWNPVFLSVFITNICVNMGQQMMNTLIPKFAYALGASATVVGMAASMFTITALAVRPFSSPAFDSFSRKKLLLVCIIDVFVAFLIFGMAQNVPTIIVARLTQGIGTGCITPLCLAMAGDALPDSKLGSGIGIFTLGQAVAQALGPNIGLSVSAEIGYNKTFLMGAGVMAIGFVVALVMKEPKRQNPYNKYKITFHSVIAKEAIPSSLLLFFLGLAFSCISSYLAIYGALRGVNNIGFYFTVYAGILLLTRPIAGTISDRFGFDKVIIPGIFFFAASFVLISIADNLTMFLLAAGIGAFGYGACQPAIQALSLKKVPKERRGAGTSTNYIFIDFGMLCGPMLAGQVVEFFQKQGIAEVSSYSYIYRFMLIPMAVALIYFLINRKKFLPVAENLSAAQPASEKI